MAPSATTRANSELDAKHERFIDDLDRTNKVILGGEWKPPRTGSMVPMRTRVVQNLSAGARSLLRWTTRDTVQ
jgi:hypothetical protein